MLKQIQSFSTKAKTISKTGLDPYKEGVDNFNTPSPEGEKLAAERLEICKGCPFFETEPIDFLRVKDNLTPEASDKMCGDCGCTISYKIRQSIKSCEKWL